MFGHESAGCRKKMKVKKQWVPKAKPTNDQEWQVVLNKRNKGKAIATTTEVNIGHLSGD